MFNITYRRPNIWIGETTKDMEIISNVRRMCGPGQYTSGTTDGSKLSTFRQTARETNQEADRRPEQILAEQYLVENVSRKVNLEVAC